MNQIGIITKVTLDELGKEEYHILPEKDHGKSYVIHNMFNDIIERHKLEESQARVEFGLLVIPQKVGNRYLNPNNKEESPSIAVYDKKEFAILLDYNIPR